MKPLIILPEGAMRKCDIKKLTDNGICVVEAKDPALVRFADPPPEGYTVQERAAISLFRRLMVRQGFNLDRRMFAEMYADILFEGFPLQPVERVVKTDAPKRKTP
jgi:hypothetical protein